MKVKILTPEWNKSFEAEAVFLPGALGEFEILEGHAPIISTLVEGEVRWRAGGNVGSQRVRGGIASVGRGEMQICVEV